VFKTGGGVVIWHDLALLAPTKVDARFLPLETLPKRNKTKQLMQLGGFRASFACNRGSCIAFSPGKAPN